MDYSTSTRDTVTVVGASRDMVEPPEVLEDKLHEAFSSNCGSEIDIRVLMDVGCIIWIGGVTLNKRRICIFYQQWG